MLRHLAVAACLHVLLIGALAGEDSRVLQPATDPDPQHMLSSYLQRIAARQIAARKEEVGGIYNREEIEKRRARIRQALLQRIGDLAEERTPLNLRRAGTLDRDGYRVEKIVYESRPKFYVTANLYVPKKGNPPYPAVLHPVGHSVTAKNRGFYQTISIGLVNHGFVVLTYDPIGQGERRVFYDRDLQDSKVGSGAGEHTMVGFQSLLAGESVARYRIWDAMRGIDLLQSLPEVDPKAIGVTGCSGGGTLTAYVAALDDRVQAAAPACYMSSWEDQLLGTGPQDAEQQFPDQLAIGIDHADFVWLAAPKPYLICSTDQDFFSLEGARKTYEEAKRIYSVLSAPERVAWFREPGPHGMPQASREVMYAWMKRWLKGDPEGPAPESRFQTEYEEDLNVTPTGQVATSLGGETASTWNMKRYGQVSPPRPDLSGKVDIERLRSRIRGEVEQLTRYAPFGAPLNISSRGVVEREGYRAERLVYQSNDGLVVPAVLCLPPAPRSPLQAVIYVDQRGKSAALAPGGGADQLARLGYAVLAIDPAGVGETAFVRNPSAPWYPYGPAWVGLMVGKPLIGLRMNDIIRGLDVLAERNLLGGGALGFARGRIAIDLLHSAVVDSRLVGLAMEESLVSYESIARTPIHRDIYEIILPGVLGKYDLVDLVATLAPRPVWLVNLRSPMDKLLFLREMESAYDYAAAAYRAAGAASHLRIRLRRESDALADAYPGLSHTQSTED